MRESLARAPHEWQWGRRKVEGRFSPLSRSISHLPRMLEGYHANLERTALAVSAKRASFELHREPAGIAASARALMVASTAAEMVAVTTA